MSWLLGNIYTHWSIAVPWLRSTKTAMAMATENITSVSYLACLYTTTGQEPLDGYHSGSWWLPQPASVFVLSLSVFWFYCAIPSPVNSAVIYDSVTISGLLPDGPEMTVKETQLVSISAGSKVIASTVADIETIAGVRCCVVVGGYLWIWTEFVVSNEYNLIWWGCTCTEVVTQRITMPNAWICIILHACIYFHADQTKNNNK